MSQFGLTTDDTLRTKKGSNDFLAYLMRLFMKHEQRTKRGMYRKFSFSLKKMVIYFFTLLSPMCGENKWSHTVEFFTSIACFEMVRIALICRFYVSIHDPFFFWGGVGKKHPWP